MTSQWVFSSGLNYYSPQNIVNFQELYDVPYTSVTDIGGHNSSTVCVNAPVSCGASTVALEYITSIATYVNTTYYYDSNSSDFVVSLIHMVANIENPPGVLLIGYGVPENQVTPAHSRSFTAAVTRLLSMGTTVVVSSGNDGASGTEAERAASNCTAYAPYWPATSPWVLTVGATQGVESDTAEMVCSSNTSGVITSGGGFSTLYAMPDYQNATVQAYFDSLNNTNSSAMLPVAGYNRQGRAYPDVAVAGNDYFIMVGTEYWFASSTVRTFSKIVKRVGLNII
jgi:tripeptidyl-peptidase-1